MIQLIKQRQVEGKATGVNLISGGTQSIGAGYRATTGNSIGDLAINELQKYVSKIEAQKANLEISSAELTAQNKIKEYEAQWSGMDRYSDEHFTDYIDGLTKVYEEGTAGALGGKYATRDQIEQFQLKQKHRLADAEFTQIGNKNAYDIKRFTDQTIMDHTGLLELYTTTTNPQEAEGYLKQSNELLVGLKGIIPEQEVTRMRIDSMSKASTKRLEYQINGVLNSELPLADKKRQVEQLANNYNSPTVLGQEINKLIKSGIIKSDEADTYKNSLQASLDQSMQGANGVLNKLNNQIIDEEYRIRQAQDSMRAQLENGYLNEMKQVSASINVGNGLSAINTVEGTAYDSSDLINSATLTKEFYDATPDEIVTGGEFIQIYGTAEANTLITKVAANEAQNLPRSVSVAEAMSEIDQYAPGTPKELAIRSLIARKVITADDAQLYFNNQQLLDNLHKGKKESSKVKSIVYSQLVKPTAFRELIGQLDETQQIKFNQAIVGGYMNGEFSWSAQAKLDAFNIDKAYNENQSFRDYVHSIAPAIKQLQPIPIKERKVNPTTLKDKTADKYREKAKLMKVTPGLQEIRVYKSPEDKYFD